MSYLNIIVEASAKDNEISFLVTKDMINNKFIMCEYK